MVIIIVHVLFSMFLFLLVNWIGRHSYSIGYVEISMFVKADDAPALNFLIRVLTPVVYIILISTVLYYFTFDKYVTNIYLVSIYYIIVRLIFNIATGRVLLINWFRQTIYWTVTVVLSYFAYEKLIKFKANVLPDFTTFANELWIIILVFVYQVVNNISIPSEGSEKRKDIYLRSRYSYFSKRYGKVVSGLTKNQVLEAIVYAVLIYEDFNRPRIIRFLENLRFKFSGKEHTLGVMQVRTEKYISDKESVILGTSKIVEAYKRVRTEPIENEAELGEWVIISGIVSDYNIGSSYNYEVVTMAQKIKELFYSDTKDSLTFFNSTGVKLSGEN